MGRIDEIADSPVRESTFEAAVLDQITGCDDWSAGRRGGRLAGTRGVVA